MTESLEANRPPLDERKERILREIVEGYVREGEPVGSKTVADGVSLGISSATVRNEMGILEREGYISHPHTSAGRIPTDKGYRYYVDVLAPRRQADPSSRREIEEFLTGAMTALDDLLKRASTLLTELTTYASVAAAPAAGTLRLDRIELVPLGGSRVLLVLVGQAAWHEERVIELEDAPDGEQLRRAVEVANRVAAGQTIGDAAGALDAVPASEAPRSLLAAVAEAMRVIALRSGRIFTGGTSRVVIWEPGPAAQRVLELLEGGGVEPLMLETEPEEMAVRIGSELGLADLDDLSLIAAGYRLGRRAGALGVLGPTRMDYPSVIASVAEVARSLTNALRRLESS